MKLGADGGISFYNEAVFPHGAPQPVSSSINFGPGQTIPNLVGSGVLPAGSLDIRNELGSVDIIGDAVGYFATNLTRGPVPARNGRVLGLQPRPVVPGAATCAAPPPGRSGRPAPRARRASPSGTRDWAT